MRAEKWYWRLDLFRILFGEGLLSVSISTGCEDKTKCNFMAVSFQVKAYLSSFSNELALSRTEYWDRVTTKKLSHSLRKIQILACLCRPRCSLASVVANDYKRSCQSRKQTFWYKDKHTPIQIWWEGCLLNAPQWSKSSSRRAVREKMGEKREKMGGGLGSLVRSPRRSRVSNSWQSEFRLATRDNSLLTL